MVRIRSVTNVGKFEIRLWEDDEPDVIVRKGRSSRSINYPYEDEKNIEQPTGCYPSFNSNGKDFFKQVFDGNEEVKFFMYPIKDEESSENVPLGKKPKLGKKETGIVTFAMGECFFELNLVASAIAPKDKLVELIKSIPGASTGIYRDSTKKLNAKKVQEMIESEISGFLNSKNEKFWGWGLIEYKPRNIIDSQ